MDVGLSNVLSNIFQSDAPEQGGGGESEQRAANSSLTAMARPIAFGVVLVGYALLLVRAASRREDWEIAVIGAGAVVIVTTMSNYYIGVLVGFGFLWLRDEGIGVALVALAALTWCTAWISPTVYETYVWISLITVLFVLAATARSAFSESVDASAGR
jgi:hypothetical protein